MIPIKIETLLEGRAAGQGTGNLPAPLLQAGKLLVDHGDAVADFTAGAGVAAHFQIFLYCHLEKDRPSLGHLGQPL